MVSGSSAGCYIRVDTIWAECLDHQVSIFAMHHHGPVANRLLKLPYRCALRMRQLDSHHDVLLLLVPEANEITPYYLSFPVRFLFMSAGYVACSCV